MSEMRAFRTQDMLGAYKSLPETEQSDDLPLRDVCHVCRRPSRPTRVLWHSLYVVCGALLLISFVVSLWFFWAEQPLLSSLPTSLNLQLETVVFDGNHKFSDPPSAETDAAWASLTEDPSGYVYIEDREQYHLQPGIDTPDGEVYGVTMYHQLHCLRLIRDIYWSLSLNPLGEEKIKHDIPNHMPGPAHVAHCLDYLRQSIQCCGDMTLGWANLTVPQTPFIDGWGVPHHQCRAWKTALPYLRAHEAPGQIMG